MQETKEQQLFFMRWAIELGEKGRLTAPPNPWVGCVVVKDGEILGEGYHVAPGEKHAEVIALEKAGKLAKGATLYVSLEPCVHQGRTPPCVNILVDSGIRRVVIPLLDPDHNVSGKGVKYLQQAGIDVVVGIGAEDAARSLQPYLHHRKTKRPFCLLKAAMSLDGRTAAADGSSQWITGEEAKENAHQLRAESQAILIGSQTALTDLPQLTVRGIAVRKQPLRVVLDRGGKVPAMGPLFDTTLAPTMIFTCNSEKKTEWEQKGVEVIVSKDLVLEEVLEELGKREILQVLVEGGSHIHSTFIKAKQAHHFTLYIGGCLLGDEGKPLLSDFPVGNINQAPRWTLENVKRFGNDVRLDYFLG